MATTTLIGAWFTRTDDGHTSWQRVIWWWELRRIPFNLLVILFATGILWVQGQFIQGGGGGSPLILLFGMAAALFLINLFYTCGWVADLIARKSKSPTLSRIRPKLFIYILVITIGIQLTGVIILTANAVQRGWVRTTWDQEGR